MMINPKNIIEEEKIIKDIRNLFRLKKETSQTAIEDLFRRKKEIKEINDKILEILKIFMRMKKKKIIINQRE